MSTITELVVAASVEPSGMKRGYDQALGFSRQFAQAVDTEFRQLGKQRAGAAGAAWADALASELTREFDAKKAVMREQLFRGALSEQEFKQQASEAARAFNLTLLEGIGELRASNKLSPIDQNRLVAMLREDGRKASEAFQQGFASRGGASAGSAAQGAGWPGRGPGLQIGGRNAAPAMVATAFGLESLARSAAAAEGGMRAASRSIATFAAGFGAGGAVVSALIAGGTAMTEWWTARRREVEETRRKYQSELAELMRGDNLMGAARLKQTLYSGDSYADIEGRREKESEAAFRARRAGIAQLRQDIARLQAEQRTAEASLLTAREKDPNTLKRSTVEAAARVDSIRKELRGLPEELRKLQEQNDKLTPVWEKLLGKNASEAAAGLRIMQDANPFAAMVEDIGRMTASYQQMNKLGLGPTNELIERMIRAQRVAEMLLDQQADKTSKRAIVLRTMVADIRSTIGASDNIGFRLPPMMGPQLGREGEAASEAIARANLSLGADRVTAMRTLTTLQGELNARVAAEGGPLRANLQLLEAQRQVTEAIRAQRVSGPGMPGALDTVHQQVMGAALLGRQAAAARAFGAGNAGELEESANAARQRAITLLRNLMQATDGQTASTLEGREAIAALLDEMGLLGDVTGQTASNFDAIKNSIRGILDGAVGFGRISSDVKTIADGVINAVDAFRDLDRARKAAVATGDGPSSLTAANIGAVIGIMGGVVGAVGGIAAVMKGDQRAREMTNQLMSSNNERLRELRMSLDGTLGGARASQRARSAASEGLEAIITNGPGSGKAFEAFVAAVRRQGLTVDELAMIAKQHGIELMVNGKLVIGALQQLDEALALSQKRMMAFTNSFGDQQSLKELHDRVFGKTSPAESFASTVELLARFAPDLAAGLQGLSITTEEGRKQVEAALQALVLRLEAGAIGLEEYGDLEGAKQLAEIILTLQGSLDGLRESADAVTRSMLNVPAGYRINLARFNATAPVTMSAPQSATDRTPWVPNNPSRLGGGSAASTVTNGSSAVSYQFGDVYVDAREEAAEDIFRKVLKVAKRRATLTFGDSTKWSQVQEA